MSTSAPRLRSDLAIVEQVHRGETSYVVKDLAAQKYFRFGAMEMRVMRWFDGRREPSEIARALTAEGTRLSATTVDAFARRLDGAGLLERTLAERVNIQLERLRDQRRTRQRARLFRGEVLRMRWSFGDPDAMIERLLPRIRWMFAPPFLAVSVGLFAAYLVLLGQEWNAFLAALGSAYAPHNITAANIMILWLTGGAVILVHELGHGCTCKYFGGEVRELGFMLLYFQPAFYCNVSDAWSFPDRRARLWVTAAGSWIQMVVASIAAFVWLLVDPNTIVARIALATMLMGGVTTLFTNLNPLLPLDGYFALSDWLGIPNLRQRAQGHFRWWLERHWLRVDLPEPAATARERRVFLIYGALSAAFVMLMFAILGTVALLWLGRTFGASGVLVGVGALVLLLRRRLTVWIRGAAVALRARRATLLARQERPRRRRLGLILAVVPVLLALLPWTLATPGEFVVHGLTTHDVIAPAGGVVAAVLVSEGMHVESGAPVARLVDRELERDMLTVSRRVDSLVIRESAARAAGNAADTERLRAQRQSALARLAALESRARHLTLRAVTGGVVVTPRPEDLIGRRVHAGDSLLTVAGNDSIQVRIALTSGGATRVRPGQVVHLVSHTDVASPWTARVTGVSVIGTGNDRTSGIVEARVHLRSGSPWLRESRGEASVELKRSSMLEALLWRARDLLRTDLWL